MFAKRVLKARKVLGIKFKQDIILLKVKYRL